MGRLGSVHTALLAIAVMVRLYSSYRPQRSCGKVMFSQASVILFGGVGGVADTPLLARHPPR